MTDQITIIEANGTYQSVATYPDACNLEPRHAYVGLRIVLTDTQPPDDHPNFMRAKPGEEFQITALTLGNSIWVRADDPLRPVEVAVGLFE